ncbi:MAG: serine/threonine-protein phosphatase [Lachnospiraceae bacterium]|nr:serine/threonine-protein phosphatase [Lachnospiraceae bacterium]
MRRIKTTYDRKQLVLASITVAFDLTLILAVILMMHLGHVDQLKPLRAMNVGLDLIGMVIGFVILIACYFDLQRTGVDYRFFRYLVQVTIVGLFTDQGAWMLMDKPELWMWNLLDNTVFFLVMPAAVYFFWRYVTQIIGREDRWVRKAEYWIRIGFIIENLVCIANIGGGYFFTVDRQGVYRRGPFFNLHMLYIIVMGVVTVALIISRRRHLTRRQIIALAIYLGTPGPVIILSIMIYGLSLNYIVCMIDTLVMYCILNVEQSRERLAAEQELATAASIQAGVLPHVFPLFPDRTDFHVHAFIQPAREVGGDLYDVFLTDESHVAFVIGDVAGKGVPAALFMVIAKTLIREQLISTRAPGEAVTRANRALCENNEVDMFVTVWVGLLDLENGHVRFVNAGHNRPVLTAADRGKDVAFLSGGEPQLVLGWVEDMVYEDEEIVLSPGDRIFLYTDGVTEAQDENAGFLGDVRLLAFMREYRGESVTRKIERIRDAIAAFRGSADQFDDITMLELEYRPAEAGG